MNKRVLDHIRHNLVAYLALFLALTMGTAYAANTIRSTDIVDGEVKNPDLAANAVTGDKVLNRSISFGDLAADSIFTGHIATGNVLSSDVRNDDLTGLDIADTNSLGGAEIAEAGLIAGGDLSGTLASAQLGASSVDSTEIADSAVKATDIATGSVNSDELAPSSVDGQKISDDAVAAEDIKAGAVESAEIADDAVKAQDIATAAVDSAEIAPDAIGPSEIGSLPAAIACCNSTPEQPVPNDRPSTLEFQVPLVNNGGVHDPAFPTRMTAPVAGLYHVMARIYWEPDSTPSGFREAAIRCNTTVGTACELAGTPVPNLIVAHEREPAHDFETGSGLAQPGMQVASLSALVPLRAGDYLEVLVYQNSGEQQTIAGQNLATASPTFSMAWVAPAS